MAEQDPILSLHTITTYQTVEIDGQRHRMLPPDSFSLFDRIDLETLEGRIGRIIIAPARTKKQEQELSKLLDQLCRRVLEAPSAVHSKLRDVQRMMIVEAFIRLPRARRRPTEAASKALKTGVRAAGGRPSRVSRASTAAAQSTGSLELPSDSSRPAVP